MDEQGQAQAQAEQGKERSYTIRINKAFLFSDKETGQVVVRDKVSRAGKPYQTIGVDVPRGVKVTVGSGKDARELEAGGYHFDMFNNKAVAAQLADASARDVTFRVGASDTIRLWKSGADALTVSAGALAHGIAEEARAFRDRGGKQQEAPAKQEPAARPRREWKGQMTPESAAAPMTDRQRNKIQNMPGGADFLAAGEHTKGEASEWISKTLDTPQEAPQQNGAARAYADRYANMAPERPSSAPEPQDMGER